MELNEVPVIESNALAGWKLDVETGELFLRWRKSAEVYVFIGCVGDFEADVREYRSWGKVAHWYANSRHDIILKEVMSPREWYYACNNRITGEFKRVPV